MSHRHASHLGILAEEVLVGDAGSCYVYGLRSEPLLHFNSLHRRSGNIGSPLLHRPAVRSPHTTAGPCAKLCPMLCSLQLSQ